MSWVAVLEMSGFSQTIHKTQILNTFEGKYHASVFFFPVGQNGCSQGLRGSTGSEPAELYCYYLDKYWVMVSCFTMDVFQA